MKDIYDIAIVGGGPAGLTCALYSARGGMKTAIIESMGMGGQTALTNMIDNYPGVPEIEGIELSNKMAEQVDKFGVNTIYDEVTDINVNDKIITTSYTEPIQARTIVLAMGASPKKLKVPGEEKFTGRGVGYCAVCDGAFYKNKTVAVVGGGNTAVEDALYLTRFAKEVYIIHRRNEFRATRILSEKIKKSNVDIIWDSVVTDINGNNKVDKVILKNVKTNDLTDLKVDGIFIAIGQKPRTDIIIDKLNLDKEGYIITDEEMRTNIEGIYAAGDIRKKAFRQIVTATSDGAIASLTASQYLINKQ